MQVCEQRIGPCRKAEKKDESCFQVDENKDISVCSNSENINDTPFKCSGCDYATNVLNDLNGHRCISKTDVSNKLKCTLCPYVAKFASHLNAHINCVHKQAFVIKCSQCDYVAWYPKVLRDHVKNVHKLPLPNKCVDCYYVAGYPSLLKEHINSAHKQVPLYKCTKCDFASSQFKNLTTHLIRIHTSPSRVKNTTDKCQSLLKCTKCEYTCSLVNTMNKHIKHFHKNHSFQFKQTKSNHAASLFRNSGNNVGNKICFPFKCTKCNFTSSIVKTMHDHIKVVHKRHTSTFKQHTNTDHAASTASFTENISDKCLQPFKCTACDFTCNLIHVMKNHTSTIHKRSQPFKYTQHNNAAHLSRDLSSTASHFYGTE